MSSEVTFACSLANPIIRSSIKKHVEEIKWDSLHARKIVDFFSQDEMSGTGKVQDATIRSYLSAEDLMEMEIDKIITKCHDYEKLDKDIAGFIKAFNTFYQRKMVAAILEETNKNPEDTASEIIRRINTLSKVETNIVPIKVLGDLDLNAVLQEEMGEDSTLPTKFQLIYDAMPLHGYLRGQLVQVCGAPGTGKSLFLMNEAVNLSKAGLKGFYLALGDLMNLDFIHRFSSLICKVSLTEVVQNTHQYWNNETQFILKNLKIAVVNAGTMDADAVADLIESRVQAEGNLDFIMIDYDSNLAKNSESMYEEGDAVYNKMSSIAKPANSKFRVVFIASQPKQMFWNRAMIPLEAASESARKQAIIDVMVTLGKAVGSSKKCGIMNIPKNRRGVSDVFTPYMLEPWGEIKEIDQGAYNLIKGFSSEDQIDNKTFKKSTYQISPN